MLVCLAAVECLVVVVAGSTRLIEHLDSLFWCIGIPTGPSAVVGFALLLLAAALRAGKRAGWWILVALLCLTALASGAATVLPAPGEPVPGALDVVLPVAWVVLLWAARSEFVARVAPDAWRRAALTVLIGLGTVVAGGWVLAAGQAEVAGQAGPRLVWVVDRLTGGTFALAPGTPTNGWIPSALNFLGAGVLVAALAVFLRSPQLKQAATDDDQLRLRSLIATHGAEDSLAWFATRRDKRVIFASNGRAAVAYRVVGGSSIASGDPIGSVADWPQAVSAWLAEARGHGWQPVVLAAGEHSAGIYHRNGLRVRRMGDEAIVDTAQLLGTGGRAGRVRRAVRRLSAEGYRTTIRRIRDVPPADLTAVAELAEHWRTGPIERGFSMASGRAADPSDLDTMLVEAIAPDGKACGLLTFAPWGSDGLSLDVMRRSPKAPAGLVEFMVGQLAATGATHGIRKLSLNFVMFRETLESGSRLGAGPVERAWHTMLRVVSSFAQIESLYHSSLTFEPGWKPRLLCWSGSTTRAAVAAGVVEGFLPVPNLISRTVTGCSGDTDFLRRVNELDALAHLPKAATRPDEARAMGLEPYPSLAVQVSDIADLRHRYQDLGRDVRTGQLVTVVGRVRACRTFGSLVFATLRSGSSRIQVIVEAAIAGETSLAMWKTSVGIDDLVLVSGEVGTSRKGELSVLVDRWTLAAPSMWPAGCEVAGDAAEQMLIAAGYLQVSLPPWHPALPGGFGAGADDVPERLFHLDRSGCAGAGPTLYVRESLADARNMLDLLYRLATALPSTASDGDAGSAAVVDHAIPWALVPFARPRQDDPDTADAWLISAFGHEIASATTGLTDPALLSRVQGSDDMIVLFERGILPFATLRVDLAALARSTLPANERVGMATAGMSAG